MPTEINTGSDITEIDDDPEGHYYLSDDIDVSGVDEFPLGDGDGFSGVLDGNGHEITGVESTGETGQGMFSVIDDGSVVNLNIGGAEVSTDEYGGILSAEITGDESYVENIHVEGSIEGGDYVGGIVGEMSGDSLIWKCESDVEVYGEDEASYIGGVCGNLADGEIFLTDSNGEVVTDNGYAVGGHTGEMEVDGRIKCCMSYSDVQGNNSIGGFIGHSQGGSETWDGSIRHCGSIGDVDGVEESTEYIGGFVGHCDEAFVLDCYTIGDVTSEDGDDTVGSLVGSSQDSYIIGYTNSDDNDSLSKAGEREFNQNIFNLDEDQMTGDDLFYMFDPYCWDEQDDDYPTPKDDKNPIYEVQTARDLNSIRYHMDKEFIMTDDVDLSEIPENTYNDAHVVVGTTIEDSMDTNMDDLVLDEVDVFIEGDLVDEDEYEPGGSDSEIEFSDGTMDDYSDSGRVALEGDIDHDAGWIPIGHNGNNGYYQTSFSGGLEGNGHTIYGLDINLPFTCHVGFFSDISSGYVKNVTFEDSRVVASCQSGILSGEIEIFNGTGESGHSDGDVTLFNVTVDGVVIGMGPTIGGLAGRLFDGDEDETLVVRCESNADIVQFGQDEHGASDLGEQSDGRAVGGLLGGANGGTVENCTSTGDIIFPDESYAIGGFIGEVSGDNVSISNSSSSGDVTGGYEIGGFIGDFDQGSVEDCTSTGDVSSGDEMERTQYESSVGGAFGIVGVDAEIENFIQSGSVTITEDSYDEGPGGFAGSIDSDDVEYSLWNDDASTVSDTIGDGDADDVDGVEAASEDILMGDEVHEWLDEYDTQSTWVIQSDDIPTLQNLITIEIDDSDDFEMLHEFQNANFVITDDIESPDIDWDYGDDEFSGVIQGEGNEIYGAEIEEDDDAAIFPRINGAVISNVNISDCTISGGENVAALSPLAERSISTLIGIDVDESVTVSGGYTISGILGRTNSSYDDMTTLYTCSSGCHLELDIVEDNINQSGSIVGSIWMANVTNCSAYTESTIELTQSGYNYGGVSGMVMHATNILNCYSDVTVEIYAGGHQTGGGVYAGGIIGMGEAVNVQGCESDSDLDAVGDDVTESIAYVGGISGLQYNSDYSSQTEYWDGMVYRCKSNSSVDSGQYIGGIVGGLEDSKVVESLFTGNVYTNGSEIGGIVGASFGGAVLDSYSIGKITVNSDELNSIGHVFGKVSTFGDIFDTHFIEGSLGYMESVYSTDSIEYSDGVDEGDSDISENIGGAIGYINDMEDEEILNVSTSKGFVWDNDNIENGGIVSDASFDEVGEEGYDTGAFDQSSNGMSTDEMTGDSAEDNMGYFDFDLVWSTTDDYPEFDRLVEETLSLLVETMEWDGDPLEDQIISIDGSPIGETDSDGQFSIDIPESGEYSVTWLNNDITRTAEIDEGEYDIEFRNAYLTGEITDVEGEPLEGEVVVLEDMFMFETDEDGEYEAEGIPPDIFDISWPGGDVVELIDLSDGGMIESDFQYAGLDIDVMHPLTEDPIPNVIVEVDTNIYRTDEEGNVEILDMPPGEYTLTAMGFWDTDTPDLDQGDMHEQEFSGEDMEITVGVTVESRESSETLSDIDVLITEANVVGETDSDGHVELFAADFDDVPHLVVAREDPRYQTVFRELDPEQERHDFDITLDPRVPMGK